MDGDPQRPTADAAKDTSTGLYRQWTANINGKTVTERLTETESRRYQRWFAKDRQLRTITL